MSGALKLSVSSFAPPLPFDGAQGQPERHQRLRAFRGAVDGFRVNFASDLALKSGPYEILGRLRLLRLTACTFVQTGWRPCSAPEGYSQQLYIFDDILYDALYKWSAEFPNRVRVICQCLPAIYPK